MTAALAFQRVRILQRIAGTTKQKSLEFNLAPHQSSVSIFVNSSFADNE
jgi:hypothetical protein